MQTNKKKEKVAIKTKSSSYPETIRTPNERFFDEYLNLNTWKMTPLTISFIQKLGEELLTWAQTDPNALTLDQWQVANGVCDTTKYRWIEKYPSFKLAWQQAKKALGVRREVGAINRKYEVSMISNVMAHYSHVWKDTAEWRAKLKGDAENKPERTIVVLPSYNEPEGEKPTPEEVAARARKGMKQNSSPKKKSKVIKTTW
jgi:hypothetical protein